MSPLGYFRLRKIIPSELKTQPAKSAEEARRKVLSLYRICLRQSGEIQSLYELDVTVLRIRQRLRQEFEKNRHVDSLPLINVLLMKGSQELEEMLYKWKTSSQIMKYFDMESPSNSTAPAHKISPGQSDFLTAFLSGKS